MKSKYIEYIGATVFILSMGLAWIWFSWKLALIIFLALGGNNMEQHNRK